MDYPERSVGAYSAMISACHLSDLSGDFGTLRVFRIMFYVSIRIGWYVASPLELNMSTNASFWRVKIWKQPKTGEKGCQWQRALQIYQEVDDLAKNVVTCSSCISALEKGRQWHRAEILLKSMLQKGPRPNIITFNAFISSLRDAEQDNWSKILVLLQRLATLPVQADDFTLVASISSIGRWRSALHLLASSRSQSTECKDARCPKNSFIISYFFCPKNPSPTALLQVDAHLKQAWFPRKQLVLCWTRTSSVGEIP